ncbi:hypothetical protein SUNI508_07000 [Seiridium unicorne]|uniref:Uncharacterized protein n=1 Tax=Seiridium unicorne TaxID=138068 RepID=A0ABR2UZG1_9PEZI
MSSLQPLTHRQNASSTAVLSRPAIIGIALGGSIIIFLVLSHIFIVLGRRRDHRRLALVDALRSLSPIANGRPHDLYDTETAPAKRRLRKRSLVMNERSVVVLDGEVDVSGRREKEWTGAPVLPPVFSRHSSYDLNPFPGTIGNGDDRSLSRARYVEREQEPSRKLEKQRGREIHQTKRKNSWIDEDALHGPKVSPRKDVSDNSIRRGTMLWFSGGLGRNTRPIPDSSVFGSPTLPHTEEDTGIFERGRPRERISTSLGEDEFMTRPPQLFMQDAPLRTEQYNASRVPVSGSTMASPRGPLLMLPPTMINNPRSRASVAFEAAQQLAGMSRLPVPQRPQPPKHRATDTDLAEILRMTTERLQDNRRSRRRQTLFAQSRNDDTGFYDQSTYTNSASNSRSSSLVNSQKSAPAVMCAELEAIEASPTKSQQLSQSPPLPPRHNRNVSQVSMVSDPDSLVAARRVSQPEHTTPLSSPSRSLNIKELPRHGEAHQIRSQSAASSHSSPLSTLYSEDEERWNIQPTGSRQPVLNTLTGLETPRFPFEEGGSPRLGPFNMRRGTLGQVTLPKLERPSRSAARTEMVKAWLPRETSLNFTIYAMDVVEDDDPFIAKTPTSLDPVRLSQVFTPIPSGTSLDEDDVKPKETTGNHGFPVVRVTKPIETPTPSPKSHRMVMPPPQVLRPVTSSPTLGTIPRRQSPALSESGLSSVYESYASSDDPPLNPSTVTLATDSTKESLPPKFEVWGRETRVEVEKAKGVDEVEAFTEVTPRPKRRSSTDSVYSQDQGQDQDQQADSGQEDDLVPPLMAPSSRNSQITETVAELRRMNSSVSAASGYSTITLEDSPTLPATHGGSFTPSRRSGGTRNYLSMGSPERLSPKKSGNPRDMVASANRDAHVANLMRTGVRARRGTLVSSGAVRGVLDSRLQELGLNVVPREGSGSNLGPVRGVREEKKGEGLLVAPNGSARTSHESLGLYDEKGFLKSSPMRRD